MTEQKEALTEQETVNQARDLMMEKLRAGNFTAESIQRELIWFELTTIGKQLVRIADSLAEHAPVKHHIQPR